MNRDQIAADNEPNGRSEDDLWEHRILVVDDNSKIHSDFRMILSPPEANLDFESAQAALFGEEQPESPRRCFQIDSAFQGQEGLAMVEKAVGEGRPYSLAFVDVRMPPGWDGVETIRHLWECYPELQVVICTAHSDYSWEMIVKELGESDSLVILKKPFDNVEVLQLAHALTKKWTLNRNVTARLANLDDLVKGQTRELTEANARLRSEIAQKTKAEEELRDSEERFSKAFQASPIPLAIISADGKRFLEVNDSFLQMCAYERTDLPGLDLQTLAVFADRASEQMVFNQLRSGDRLRKINCQIERKTHEFRDALFSGEALWLGGAQNYLLLLEDVTEQRELECQLRQSQKMQAIGQLAAGVAHDFNNILTIIQGYTAVLLQRADLEKSVAASFQKVHDAARRAANLTGQLLAFSRQQRMRTRPVDLSEVLRSFGEILSRCLTETVSFTREYAEDLPKIEADPVNLEQVVMNLAVNARDAMPKGGKLTVTTRAVELDGKSLPKNCESRAGKYVCLSVRDTGCGMDPATRERIFEPFFTTKGVGKGTGLGLATVYGIVKQHGGWIDVQSQVGAGTTFRVYFPALHGAKEAPAQLPEAGFEAVPADTGKRILVVEDEPVVRELVCETLSATGYPVFSAGDGAEALEICSRAAKPFDLLVTDMVMPNGMSGLELAKRLGEKSPELKVVYMSGYTPEWPEVKLIPGVNFVAKPYDPQELLNAVAERLRARTGVIDVLSAA